MDTRYGSDRFGMRHTLSYISPPPFVPLSRDPISFRCLLLRSLCSLSLKDTDKPPTRARVTTTRRIAGKAIGDYWDEKDEFDE